MLTLVYLLLVAFTSMEMNLIVLGVVAFVDMIALGVLNNIFGDVES